MSIKKGIVASVVAGVILIVIPKPDTWFDSMSKWFHGLSSQLLDIIFDEYSLTGWQWLLLFPFVVSGFIFLLSKLLRNHAYPEHYRYIEDTIRNAKWRWSWSGGKIRNLASFCPHCDCALVYSESNMREHLYGRAYTKLFCESCNDSEVATIDGGDRHYAYALIEREIERRVRTNEYKKH